MAHLLIAFLTLWATLASAMEWEGAARSGNIEDRRALSFRNLYGEPSYTWISQKLTTDGQILFYLKFLHVSAPSHGGQAVRIQIMMMNKPAQRELSYSWVDDDMCEMIFKDHVQGFGHTVKTLSLVPGEPDSGTIVHHMYCGTQFVNPFIIWEGITGDR